METLTGFAIERWRLTLTAIVLIVFAGTYTYLRQPSQEDPEIVIRTAVVTVAFPGMSASRVEQLLIKPVEEAAKQSQRRKPSAPPLRPGWPPSKWSSCRR